MGMSFKRYYWEVESTSLLSRILLYPKRHKFFYPEYFHKKHIMSEAEGSDYLASLLIQDRPFFVGRIGGVEGDVMYECFKVRIGLSEAIDENVRRMASINAGIFSNSDVGLQAFTDIYYQSALKMTAIASWGRKCEELVVENSKSIVQRIPFLSLYPGIHTWTKALRGRRVLVVHPFVETFTKQYLKRARIYPSDQDLLPPFSLITYCPIVSHANQLVPYSSWELALNKMQEDLLKLSDLFDVCLVGCGAYGLPLSAFLYSLGKQVIHVGGSLQLLFGVIGGFCFRRKETTTIINDSWVYPSKDETPRDAFLVEGGCYWDPSK